MKYKTVKTNKVVTLLLCVMLLITCMLFAMPTASVYAKTKDILDDFSGTDFNVSDYPVKLNDYSLQLIQLAEADSGSLVVYVYQPSAGNRNVLASSINIALGFDENSTPKNYTLTLLGSSQTIVKYKVNNLLVGTASERYYNVSSIYRPYNKAIDGDQKPNITVNEIAYPVGQQWTFCTDSDGNIICSYRNVITIEVTDRFDGTLRYLNGEQIFNSIDRHFIAFSTDISMEDVVSADVSYRSHQLLCFMNIESVGDPNPPETVHITGDELFSNHADWFPSYGHSWYGIETVDTFLKKETLRPEVRKQIESKQWVLSFLVTDFKKLGIGTPVMGNTYVGTAVSEVTILELSFMKDGSAYTLGVVDDKVTSDPYPVNWNKNIAKHERSFWEKIWDAIVSGFNAIGDFFVNLFTGTSSWWTYLIIAVAVILILIFLPIVGPVIISGLKIIAKALLWLITAPFRLVKWIVEKIRERKGGAA